jgi:hypothetical protein
VLMDLADVAGNVVDGAHIASTGGVWMALTYGFGGMRDHHGRLSFDPRLPTPWRQLRFNLRFQDRQLVVEITHGRFRVELTEGDPLTIEVRGREHTLELGEPTDLDPGELPVEVLHDGEETILVTTVPADAPEADAPEADAATGVAPEAEAAAGASNDPVAG